jgi:hypothetical protein
MERDPGSATRQQLQPLLLRARAWIGSEGPWGFGFFCSGNTGRTHHVRARYGPLAPPVWPEVPTRWKGQLRLARPVGIHDKCYA